MTREEKVIALYCLKASSDYHSEVCEECIKYPNCDHTIQDDVTETIIRALEQMPNEDCVSRADLIDKLEILEKRYGSDFYWEVRKIVDILPPVTPVHKVGKWENLDSYHYYNDGEIETAELRCSCCNEIVEWDIESPHKPHYCENCGVEMESE